MQDQEMAKNSPSGHHRATLSGYIFTTKAHIDNREKNLLSSSNISPRRPHNTVNFGPLTAEIGPVVWGTPANFNGFRVLAALLHGSPVVGVSQTLRRWTEAATSILHRGHHVGHCHSLSCFCVFLTFLSQGFWRLWCYSLRFSHSRMQSSSAIRPGYTVMLSRLLSAVAGPFTLGHVGRQWRKFFIPYLCQLYSAITCGTLCEIFVIVTSLSL